MYLLLLFGLVLANLRFKDSEQLERHHTHISDSNEFLKVHLIPHSHDDVGWLKTVDQYFFGTRNDIQWAVVEYVIDSYIESLTKDPKRHFIQVETAFFKKWWDLQTEEKRTLTKSLVKSGQIEFISGGWCMNDEATPYYEDIIDQMTLGHKFLLDNFDVKPTIGWQIDPFGHQNTQAAFSNQMGFDGWFFSRIDYQDKEKRLNEKTMEMIVIPNTQGVQYPIFSHVQYYHYEAPRGFSFDAQRKDDPIVDDKTSILYNLETKATEFVNYFKAQSTHYQSNVLTHTMGSDFLWSNAAIIFKNLDKLINYINSEPKFNMQLLYSTPSLYLQDLNEQKLTFPTKNDDFFPYSDHEHAYWTGYFTSRVAIKGYVKSLGRQAQAYRKLIAYQTLRKSSWAIVNTEKIDSALWSLNEALGICQHHDAVSGTEMQHVNDDYLRILSKGEHDILAVVTKLTSELLFGKPDESIFSVCNLNSTAAECTTSFNAISNNKTLIVALLDGKIQSGGQVDKIRLKVPNQQLMITDWEGKAVDGDILCTTSATDCDLVFLYTIPTNNNNGLLFFKIWPVTSGGSAQEVSFTKNPINYNDDTYISLNGSKAFKLRYGYYESYQESDQPSGAYIFRPVNATTTTKKYGVIVYTTQGFGKVVSVFTILRTNTRTVIRKYSHQVDTYEIQTFIDSIPVVDGQGKEVVMLVDTDIRNSNIFYTDSNGLELQKRILNYQPTWTLKVHEPSAGNYYPFTGLFMLNDDDGNAAALLNDRSQGATSLRKGQMEVMIHRRLLKDDSRGVEEPLNEKNSLGQGLQQIVVHTLTFYNSKANPNHPRKLQYFSDLAPIPLLTQLNTIEPKLPVNFNWLNVFPGISFVNNDKTTPNLVKFYIQNWNKGEYLIRTQNFQETGTITVNMDNSVNSVQTTLTGNQPLAEWNAKKLKWNYAGCENHNNNIQATSDIMNPLQIFTYIVKAEGEIVQ